MAILLKRKRLFNPGRLKRKRVNSTKRRKSLSPKQIKFFGTPAQKAALKRKRSNGKSSKAAMRLMKRYRPSKKRRANIGEIITLDLVRKNSGKRKMKMAKKRRVNSRRRVRRVNVKRANPRRRRRMNTRRRRRTNSGVVIRRRRRNTGGVRRRRRNVGSIRRRRRSNVGRRRRNSGYRRNPIGSSVSKGLGIVLGMFTTGKIVDMVSAQIPSLASGPTAIATTAVVALIQGWAVKKFFGKADLGENIAIGGLALAVIKGLNTYLPQFAPSLSGLGLIGGSSFTYPQVNVPGKYGNFLVAPDYQTAITSAVSAANAQKMASRGMSAIYPNAVGGGRWGMRRVGRTN